jgi:hypothetical protein
MAEFRIDQTTPGPGTPGRSRTDLVAGEVITLVATEPVGVGVTYAWELIDKAGAGASLTATTGTSVNIGASGGQIPELSSFKVRLTANDNGTITVTERIACVRSTVTGLRRALFAETSPGSQSFSDNDPDLSTDNDVYADLAGTGITGQNWRGYAQWLSEVVDIVEGLSGGGYIPSGPASGDLGSNYPGPTVVGIRGRAVAATAPTNGQGLVWSASNNRWEPGTVGGGGSALELTQWVEPIDAGASPAGNTPAGSPDLLFTSTLADEPAVYASPYWLYLENTADSNQSEYVLVIGRTGSTRHLATRTLYEHLAGDDTRYHYAGPGIPPGAGLITPEVFGKAALLPPPDMASDAVPTTVTNASDDPGESVWLARADHRHALDVLIGTNYGDPVLFTASADLLNSGVQLVPGGITSGGAGGGSDIFIGPGQAPAGNGGKGVTITGGVGAVDENGGPVSIDAGGSNGGPSVGGNVRLGRDNAEEILIGRETLGSLITLEGTTTLLGHTPTSEAHAATKGYVDQPGGRTVPGNTDTVLTGDIGNTVFYSNAGGVTVTLNSLAANLIANKVIVITLQATNAATVITVDPGTGSVTIDGSASNFVAATGKSRVSLMSLDGVNFYSGTP